MKSDPASAPQFLIDSLPDIPGTKCREVLRNIKIHAGAADIFLWLNQLRVAPYSYDWLDNRGRRSPGYIIENMPPMKANTHILLAFHIFMFEEDSFMVCRFCEPVNRPLNLYLKSMFIEYRIKIDEPDATLWCKIKSYLSEGFASTGFFFFFSLANKIMMTRQLKNIRELSELTASGDIEAARYDFTDYFARSGIHWWVFCRRSNCKGLIT